jgi:hypothetical protein
VSLKVESKTARASRAASVKLRPVLFPAAWLPAVNTTLFFPAVPARQRMNNSIAEWIRVLRQEALRIAGQFAQNRLAHRLCR